MKSFWIPALLLALGTSAQAKQVFSHDSGGVHWEVEVTEASFVLRESTGASAGSEVTCPLGPAVRASVVRAGPNTGKVCLVFSRDKCTYKSIGGAPAAASAPYSGGATFKCVALGTAEQANSFSTLVNAGSQTHGHTRSATASEREPRRAQAAPATALSAARLRAP